jgi:outer membrane protein insertion porin family
MTPAALVALAALALASGPPLPAAAPAPDAPAAGAPAAPAAAPEGDLDEEPPADGPRARPLPARAYLVERVAFAGLDHVREWAARRHVVVQEGQTLDEQRVLVSRLRLLQLGWFSRVDTRVEKGSARGQVVVVFDVTERNTLVVSELLLGSTDPQPLFGGLGLSQQNFLGQGLTLGGAFAWGGSPEGRAQDPARFALRGGFYAPDVAVAGQRFAGGASALWLRGEELTCPDATCSAFTGRLGEAPRLRYERIGGEVTFGVRPGPYERVSLGWRGERLEASGDPGVGPVGPVPSILLGRSTLSALVASWEYDSRDDLFFPTGGLYTLAQVTFGSALLGSDYEYSRYVLQAESGFGLLGRPLRLQAFVGAVQGGAPFFERFYAADLSYFAVGPALGRALELNFSTDSRYDAFAAMGGLEYAVPLWSHGRFFQRGYLALGARAVWSSARPGGGRTGFSSWPVSLDAALRFDTPIGTFNASLGAALDNLL